LAAWRWSEKDECTSLLIRHLEFYWNFALEIPPELQYWDGLIRIGGREAGLGEEFVV
jgi:hypothetical protein